MKKADLHYAALLVVQYPNRTWDELLWVFREAKLTKGHGQDAFYGLVRQLRDDGYPVQCDYKTFQWRLAVSDRDIHEFIDEYWNRRGILTTLFRGIQSSKDAKDKATVEILMEVLKASAFKLAKSKVERLLRVNA